VTRGAPNFQALDRNLRRLLREAYVPVELRAAFRAELQARLERVLAERTNEAGRTAARREPSLLRFPRIAAAAAAVLFPLIAWFAWQLVDYVQPTYDDILAQGHVAVREDEHAWRALTPDELEHGIDLAEPHMLALRTPRSIKATILSENGLLEVRADTALRVQAFQTADDPGGLSVHLAHGTVVAKRDDGAPGHWSILPPEAALLLAHGSLLVSAELNRISAYVYSGETSGNDTELLPLETWLTLRDDRFVPDAAPNTRNGRDLTPSVAEGPSQREAVESTPSTADDAAASSLPTSEPTAAAVATLAGQVHSTAYAQSPASFVVVLLRQVRLPAVAQPAGFPFDAGSSQDGRFSIPAIDPGTYKVFVIADGFATWSRAGVVLDAGDTHELLVDLSTGMAVAGRVVDQDTGVPIEGAFVLSENDAPTQILPIDLARHGRGLGAVVTDHQGRFELAHLSAGTHILRASAPAHGATWSSPLELADGERIDDVALELGPGAVLHGRVTRDDGTPWKNAFVVASLIGYTFARPCMTSATTSANEDGSFELTGLPPGIFVVLNTSEAELGRSPRIRSIPVAQGQRVRVDLGDALGTRVVGTLTDADGDPVVAHDIALIPLDDERMFHSARTAEDGSYELQGLPPGTYAGYFSREMATDMTLLGPVEVPAVPELRHDFQLRRTRLGGRVTADGAPLSQAVVILERIGANARQFVGTNITDEHGRYSFTGVAPGEYDVSTFATTGSFGEERIEGLFLLDSEELDEIDFELLPGGSLLVRVTDRANAPIKGAHLSFTDERGRQVLFNLDERTDARGHFTVAGLSPGLWTVLAQRGDAQAEDRIEVREGIESVLHLVPTP